MMDKYRFAIGLRLIAIFIIIIEGRKIIIQKLKKVFSIFKNNYNEQNNLIKFLKSGELPSNYIKVPLFPVEKYFMRIVIRLRSFSIGYALRIYKNRPEFIDKYVICYFIILILILFFCYLLITINLLWFLIIYILLSVIVIYRIIEGVNYLMCIFFVDRYKKDWKPSSINRSILLLLINYLEIIIGFAIFYLITGSIAYSTNCKIIIKNPIEVLYFSTVTITTLGYGDMRPINLIGQMLVILEPLLGFILIVLVLGMFFLEAGRLKNNKKNY